MKFFEKENLVRFSALLDNEVVLALEKLALELRSRGYTRMNRSFLISAAAYKLVSAYREGGVDEAVKLLEHQLSVYANNKNISLDKNEVEE